MPRQDRPLRRSASYSTELAILRDYLRYPKKHGLDPYDFQEYLGEYFDDVGQPEGEVPEYPEDMTEEQLADFREWLEKNRMGERRVSDDPVLAPSYLHLDYEKVVPPTTWLVHFSDAAGDIATEGFQSGTPDIQNLGLTTMLKKQGPGWNFAFVADSKEAKSAAASGKYGKHAVLFLSAGVQAYHWGDEESQVIFWGPGAKNSVPIYRREEGWTVESGDGRELFKGDFEDVVNWVMANYPQYRRVLGPANASNHLNCLVGKVWIRNNCKFAQPDADVQKYLDQVTKALRTRGWQGVKVLPYRDSDDEFLYKGGVADLFRDEFSKLSGEDPRQHGVDEWIVDFEAMVKEQVLDRGVQVDDWWDWPDSYHTPERIFGFTDDLRLAGYILPDGSLLDMSEGSGMRSADHRQVAGLREGSPGTAGMQEYMAEGNIRVDANSGMIDLSAPPTEAQKRRIAEIVRVKRGEVILDMEFGLGEKKQGDDYYYKPERNKRTEFPIGTNPTTVLKAIGEFFQGPAKKAGRAEGPSDGTG